MLTLTVRRLERDGLALRTVYPTVPAQVDYRLTETGASLTHLVKALADWSLEHRDVIAHARHAYDERSTPTTKCGDSTCQSRYVLSAVDNVMSRNRSGGGRVGRCRSRWPVRVGFRGHPRPATRIVESPSMGSA
ncbi:helix-turn-helix transcriptional regulator [Nocardia sp. NBC_00881]|uniref:winged helix-turn-helix transcriptional regulator n=1 Tax=Nocardia sp. NBC_00881 TaxID=2975995 RepID=UPI00386D1863|nr:helix-turn-helix transcriptional regulator [Nocardia sp. NBC_00881]